MATKPLSACLQVEPVGDVTVVRFTAPMLWGYDQVQLIGEHLFCLVEEGKRKLLLNLGAVESMDSSMLGKLIALHKKLEAEGGRLALCQFQPELYANFETLKLALLLNIYSQQDEALKSFA